MYDQYPLKIDGIIKDKSKLRTSHSHHGIAKFQEDTDSTLLVTNIQRSSLAFRSRQNLTIYDDYMRIRFWDVIVVNSIVTIHLDFLDTSTPGT